MRNILLAALAAISIISCTKTNTTPTYNLTGYRWYQSGDTTLHLTFTSDSLYIHHPALLPNPSATPYTRQANTINLSFMGSASTLTITADTLTWSNNTTSKTAKFYRKY